MLNPSVDYVGTKARVNFNGDCFKQAKISFDPGKIVNVYFFYEKERNISVSSYPTLDIFLFGVVKSKKMLILICINILDMVLGLTEKVFFQFGIKLV